VVLVATTAAAATTTTTAAATTAAAAVAAAAAAVATTAAAAVAAAATTTTAAAAAAEAAAAAATATTAGLVLGLVHPDAPAVELFAVQAFDGLIAVRGIVERHKTKATGASRVAIENDLRLAYRAELLKGGTEGVVARCPRKATNKQFL
jgi:hypothetical protein